MAFNNSPEQEIMLNRCIKKSELNLKTQLECVKVILNITSSFTLHYYFYINFIIICYNNVVSSMYVCMYFNSGSLQ